VSNISSGGSEHPKTDEQWRAMAQSILDRMPRNPGSYVEAALHMAHYVVNSVTPERDFVALVDNFNATSARCSQVLEQRRALVALIEKIALAHPDDRDELIAEALVAARAAQ